MDQINNPVFALYRVWSDGSGQSEMIYIGSDKAAAFDALMAFSKREYFSGYDLRLDFASTSASEATNG